MASSEDNFHPPRNPTRGDYLKPVNFIKVRSRLATPREPKHGDLPSRHLRPGKPQGERKDVYDEIRGSSIKLPRRKPKPKCCENCDLRTCSLVISVLNSVVLIACIAIFVWFILTMECEKEEHEPRKDERRGNNGAPCPTPPQGVGFFNISGFMLMESGDEIYAGGKLITKKVSQASSPTNLTISGHSRVIAISARRKTGGVQVKFSDETKSDDEWKCSQTEQNHNEWYKEGFDDSRWEQARVVQCSTNCKTHDFLNGAKFMWCGNNHIDRAYFRKERDCLATNNGLAG